MEEGKEGNNINISGNNNQLNNISQNLSKGMIVKNLNSYGSLQMADVIINKSGVLEVKDRSLVQLIQANASSVEEVKNLVKYLEAIKSDSSSEENKEEAGGFIKKFLDQVTSEGSKQIAKSLLANGIEYAQYLI